MTLAHRRLRDLYLARSPAADTTANRADPFAVRLWPERLSQPDKWQEPRMVFVNSMSDLFHRDIPDSYIRSVFETMLRVDRHIYQVLTKRPSRALRFWDKNRDLFADDRVPAHIWTGTSVEDQRVAYRVDHLRRLPACVRFLSCEPLLGPLAPDLEGIHWLIAGGESGIGHRKMAIDWARALRDQCAAACVPFFFKQVGGRTPKAGGRLLDGRTWDEYPEALTVSA